MKIVLPITLVAAVVALVSGATPGQAPAAVAELPELGPRKSITAEDCTAMRLGASLPTSTIGEPVSAVTAKAPQWTGVTDSAQAYCTVEGAIAPVATEATARPINFRVVL